jgi:hypothetical protein
MMTAHLQGARTRASRPAGRDARAPGGDGVTLSSSIWKRFSRTVWERQSGCLRDAFRSALVPADMMFRALLMVAARCRAGEDRASVCFWINGVKTTDYDAYLPEPADVTLTRWVSRIDAALSGADYTLLVANPHLVSDEVWLRARQFVRGLFDTVGVPSGGADTTFFIGRYKRTPFGVHRGQMSVMTFPIGGEKRFRVWPAGYGEAHPDIRDTTDYPDHLAASSELVGTPKDILYWPADVWHIAEGDGELTSTFNIGFWWDRPPLAWIFFEVARQLTDRLGDQPDEIDAYATASALHGQPCDFLPAPVAHALDATRAVVGGEALKRALALNWMRVLSADGFRDAPERRAPVAGAPLQPGERVRRCTTARILFAAGQQRTIYIAADGHMEQFADTPAARRALITLIEGGSAKVDDAPTAAILSWLYAGGVVRR